MYVSFDDDDDDDDDYDEREEKAAIKSKAETDRDAIRRHKYWCAFSNNLDTVVFHIRHPPLLSGVLDYFDRNKISSGGDLSHYSSASLY